MGKHRRFSGPPAKPRFQAPNLLGQAVANLDAGRLQDAENAVRLLLAASPKDGDALNVMGVIELRRGRNAAAIDAFKRAAAVQPRNPGVHLNLGNAFLRANQPKAALDHYETATRLRPGYADAEALKGDALRRLARWPEAALAYERALRGKKDHFAALNGYGLCLLRNGDATGAVEMLSTALERLPSGDRNNRANVLANLGSAMLQTGEGVEGLSALAQAVTLLPESDEISHLLAQNLRHVRVVPEGEAFEAVLQRLLERSDISPSSLASAAVATLKSQPDMSAALEALGQEAVDDVSLQILTSSSLLMTLLKKTPIPDQDVELAMTNVRRHFLLSAGRATLEDQSELICALAQQCFLNEYIYNVTAEEEDAVASLAEALSTSKTTDWASLALLACYLPLVRLDKFELDRTGMPSRMAPLIKQQVDEPKQEQAYAIAVQALTPVTDAISKAVQDQYEENPYPRWTGFSLRAPRPFREAIRDALPHLAEDQLPHTDAPRVLIAGCGTGLETMGVVSSYLTASVLAVDLSRKSLAYGMRKLAEYGFSGVEHGQADILALDKLDSRFDLIHSFGVIHHMSDPQRGLSVLARLLDPGGFLFVGLYSTIARKPVTQVRHLIAEQGVPPTPAGIRGLRRQIMRGEADPQLSILASPASDFWAMSDCRDLMFHVEEHQFTLLEIEQMFAKAGLEFLGLQVPYAPDLTRFREENLDPADLASLEAWHRFEERHPQVFGGTYQLWARKPAAAQID